MRKNKKVNKKNLKIKDRLIISVDVNSKNQLISLCKKINNEVTTLKLGLELIYSIGLDVIKIVKSLGYHVMLDAKLNDIPNTVNGAVSSIDEQEVKIITIHALGGKEMLRMARLQLDKMSAKNKRLSPLLFGVTILTSLGNEDLNEMGFKNNYNDSVLKLVRVIIDSGIDGVICSPNEVKLIRNKYGKDLYIATPGIRLPGDNVGDQKRVNTPEKAISDGADFLIVGRSITKKANIGKTINLFLEKIERTLDNAKNS